MNNNNHFELAGYNFCYQPITPFEDWIGNMNNFCALTRPDQEKIFLRWKWGYKDERACESLETTEQYILHRYKDSNLGELSEAVKFHIDNKRRFDRFCFETKKQIGLIGTKNPLVDRLKNQFDARES